MAFLNPPQTFEFIAPYTLKQTHRRLVEWRAALSYSEKCKASFSLDDIDTRAFQLRLHTGGTYKTPYLRATLEKRDKHSVIVSGEINPHRMVGILIGCLFAYGFIISINDSDLPAAVFLSLLGLIVFVGLRENQRRGEKFLLELQTLLS